MFNSRYPKGSVNLHSGWNPSHANRFLRENPWRIFYYLKDTCSLNNFVVVEKEDNQGLFPDSAIYGGVPVIFLWWQFLPGQLFNQGGLFIQFFILPTPEGYLRL
jgi:hypothetical protein